MLTDRLEHPVEHAAVIGASFIALETAAALRARDVKVTVVAPDAVPLAKILGEELGATSSSCIPTRAWSSSSKAS